MRRLVKVLDWPIAVLFVFSLVAHLLKQFAGYGDLVGIIPGPVEVVCMAYVLIRFAVPFAIGRGQPAGEIPRPADRPTAEAMCGGKIGLVHFQGPLLRISVYPDRFVLRMFWREHTIMGHDIDSLRQDVAGRLAISHGAPDTRSPIRLFLKQDHPARAAIEQIDMTREGDHFDRIHWDE